MSGSSTGAPRSTRKRDVAQASLRHGRGRLQLGWGVGWRARFGVAVILFAGCGTRSPRATPALPPLAPPAVTEPVLELLDPGSEPREPLRLQVADAASQTVVVKQRATIELVLSQELPRTVTVPGQRMTFKVSSRRHPGGSDLTLTSELAALELTPEPGADAHLTK